MLIFFLNDVDILILEFKNSFVRYHLQHGKLEFLKLAKTIVHITQRKRKYVSIRLTYNSNLFNSMKRNSTFHVKALKYLHFVSN